MSVGRICTRTVFVATPEETVAQAARRMRDENVGTLVVVNIDSRPIGVVTDRDVALRSVGAGLNPAETAVRDIMSSSVRTVGEEVPIESALGAMAAGEVRRMVVVDEHGKLAGLLALDDVIELLVEEAETVGKLLRLQAAH